MSKKVIFFFLHYLPRVSCGLDMVPGAEDKMVNKRGGRRHLLNTTTTINYKPHKENYPVFGEEFMLGTEGNSEEMT